MPDELKGLIEKIREEAIKVSEDKAKAIEDEARRQAETIVKDAKREASRLIESAKAMIKKMEESSSASLRQAGRDFLLSLRKEIAVMLDRIVTSHVHRALDAEELTKIITSLVKEYKIKQDQEVIVSLKKEDLEKIEKGFLTELRSEIKKGVILKSSDEISGGFMISYDSGKSYYDFTDKALAKYISHSLKPRLAAILNETVV